jgi:hypothetical protein
MMSMRALNAVQAMEMFERLQKFEHETETACAYGTCPPIRLRCACTCCSRHTSSRLDHPV